MQNPNHPRVGLGIIIVNDQGEILVGRRKGTHAPKYAVPGGHLELGETFEQGAFREVREETGLEIVEPKVIAVTNNLETYKEEGKHYISVILVAKKFSGYPQVIERDKCEGWIWVNPCQLPQPCFDATALAVKCYLDGTCYVGI